MRYPKEERTFTILRLLEKTQWWKPSELDRFQQKRFKILLKHAYQNVPYYHKLFDNLGLKPQDIKNVEDLKKLPVLKKEIIRNNLENLTAVNYSKDQLISSKTGGSTGEPMEFFIDKKWKAWNTAAAHREWNWAGYKIGDKIAYLWGSLQDFSHQDGSITRFSNLMRRVIKLNTFNMTEKTLDKYVEILRVFKPKIINAYASAVYLMAKYMEKEGIEDIQPRAILTSCEMLFDYQREIIEKVFGCKVFDYYSGRDTTLHAGECTEHSGYHLAIENAVVEFIKNDENVAPGEMGKIIITDLSNYAMPFIRYEIGDLGVPSDEICSCGRGLPIMKSIEGRTTDILRRVDGGYISSPGLTVAIDDLKNVIQIQIIQKKKDQVILKVVRGKNYSDRDSKLLKTIMKKYLGNDMNIDISFVESIPTTKSGKYRFTISEIGIDI